MSILKQNFKSPSPCIYSKNYIAVNARENWALWSERAKYSVRSLPFEYKSPPKHQTGISHHELRCINIKGHRLIKLLPIIWIKLQNKWDNWLTPHTLPKASVFKFVFHFTFYYVTHNLLKHNAFQVNDCWSQA